MNTIWVLSVFLFNGELLENNLLEKKEFKTVEECIAQAQKVIETKEHDKKKPSHLHYTASCIPKND